MDLIFLLVAIILGYVVFYAFKSTERPAGYPPGPSFMPIVGNTLQLRRACRKLGSPHLVYEEWSRQYKTRVLGLKLGSELVVVALSYPLVHEIHLSELYDARPDNFFLRLRTMGTRKGITCTDGPLWSEHRNFATRQLRQVGYGRSAMDAHIAQEANDLVAHISEQVGDTPTWPATFLATRVINVLWSLTAGKRYAADDKRLSRLLELMNRRSKAFDVSGGVLAQFPWLRFIAPNRTGYNLVRELNSELYHFFMDIIAEHKSNMADKANIDNDFIYAYLHEMQSQGAESGSFSETQLVMTILDFFIAGSQTTSNTIDLALLTLALRPQLQDRLYNEITANCHDNPKTCVHLSERAAYPLMDAFIMEVQRYFHITPVTGPRRALATTQLDGFVIPKNTTILIGLRSVLMDQEHWGDAQTFRPDRFLDDGGRVRKDEYFMPFGQGRRRCLGDTLARACLFSFLIKIVSNFRIDVIDEEPPVEKVLPGITLSAQPYNVRFVARNAAKSV